MEDEQKAVPNYWLCRSCGCLWRDNHDGTVSLAGPKQSSCRECENDTPFNSVPLYGKTIYPGLLAVPKPQVKDDVAVLTRITEYWRREACSTSDQPFPRRIIASDLAKMAEILLTVARR